MRSAAGSNIDPRSGSAKTELSAIAVTVPRPPSVTETIQLESTATMAPDTGLIRPAQALDLHQRPSLTVLQLVHTEEDTPLN